MAEKKVKVRLYGKLRQFGRDFEFYVNTKKEIFRALTQIEGFEKFMLDAESKGVGFAIFEDKKNLCKDDLEFTAKEGKTLRIAPVIMGSKSGGFVQILVGAALVAASFLDWWRCRCRLSWRCGWYGINNGGRYRYKLYCWRRIYNAITKKNQRKLKVMSKMAI